VQAQDLQIGENQTRTLDDWRDLRESGNVSSRKNVLLCPCTRDGWAIAAAYRMNERDAISAQQFPDLLEESCIVWNADMLEHSD
jgi:hypothetical protein